MDPVDPRQGRQAYVHRQFGMSAPGGLGVVYRLKRTVPVRVRTEGARTRVVIRR